MQSLACHACGICVLVAKYSPPAHTSIQWTDSSDGACHELAAARAIDPAAYLLRCEALDRTVDAAVAEGRIPQTTRVEPDLRPPCRPRRPCCPRRPPRRPRRLCLPRNTPPPRGEFCLRPPHLTSPGGLMTIEQDRIEIRNIEAGNNPTRFARGWHCIGSQRISVTENPPTRWRFSGRTWSSSPTPRANFTSWTPTAGTWAAIWLAARSRAMRSHARSTIGAGTEQADAKRSRTHAAPPRSWRAPSRGPRWNATEFSSSGTALRERSRRRT